MQLHGHINDSFAPETVYNYLEYYLKGNSILIRLIFQRLECSLTILNMYIYIGIVSQLVIVRYEYLQGNIISTPFRFSADKLED